MAQTPNPIQIDFDFNPSVHILAAEFDMIALGLRSFREPLKTAIQKVMAPSFKKNFDLGGRPPWDELRAETLEQKTLYSASSDILVKTGLLRKVAQQLNLWKIGTDEAMIQEMPRAEYGAIHQEGSSTVPRREWAVIQPEDMDAIDEIFADWVGERFAAHGFTRGVL